MAYKIYLSPSDQKGNIYATGNTNEMVQCRRIADILTDILKAHGFEVTNGNYGDMYERVYQSNLWESDLHVCIHTNAANGIAHGTRGFYFEPGGKGAKAVELICYYLSPITPGKADKMTDYPTLYEIRASHCPCAYIEVEFHDAVDGAEWIISHTDDIARAIAHGICDYFSIPFDEVVKDDGVYYVVIGKCENKEDAEKMVKTAKLDYPDATFYKVMEVTK